MIPNPLRRLPSVHDLLESPPLRAWPSGFMAMWSFRRFGPYSNEVRQEFQTAASDRSLPNLTELADRIVRRIAERETVVRPHFPKRPGGGVAEAGRYPFFPLAINATGAILHAGLGPPPLAEEAIAEMAAAARNYGGFGDRGEKGVGSNFCADRTLRVGARIRAVPGNWT